MRQPLIAIDHSHVTSLASDHDTSIDKSQSQKFQVGASDKNARHRGADDVFPACNQVDEDSV